MNRDQVQALTRLVKAACPQQQVDEFTPDAWHALGLCDVDPQDGLVAVRRLVARQPFVALSEIMGEVRAIRVSRIEHDVDLAVTPITRTEVAGFMAELRRRTGVAASSDGGGWPRRALGPARPYAAKPGQAGATPGDPHPEMASVRAQLARRRDGGASLTPVPQPPSAAPYSPAQLAGYREAATRLVGRHDWGEAPLAAAAAELGEDASAVAVAVRAAELAAKYPDTPHREQREAS